MSRGIASNPEALKRLKRRYREEGRFRAYGLVAIGFAILSLAVLLVSIVGESISAFTKHELVVDLVIDPAVVDPTGARDPAEIASNVSAFSDLLRQELQTRFPGTADDLTLRRQINRMVSTLAGRGLAERVAENPVLVGQTVKAAAPISDVIDLYLKGLVTDERILKGSAAASVSRIGGEVTVRAPGAFTAVYADTTSRIRDEAELKTAAVDTSRTSIDRLNNRIAGLTAERQTLASLGAPGVAAEAEAYVRRTGAGDVALVRLAGAVVAGSDVSSLRAALQERLAMDASAAEKEAEDLLKRGASYAGKAAAALRGGQPTAETRRIQSETAYLAADRRRVDTMLLKAQAAAVPSMDRGQMLAAVSVLTGRPLAPLAELAAAGEPERRRAVLAVNAAEIAAAEAAVRDQEARIAALIAEAEELASSAPSRAAALEATALPAADARLNRLNRDLDARREMGGQLAGLAAEPAAPAGDATLVANEREAQLGLDLGGPLAAAFALGVADANAPGAQAALKALMLARADLEIADARTDIERLSRKRDRDAQMAQNILSRIGQEGAPITLDEFSPSLLVEINGGVVKALRVSQDEVAGQALIALESETPAAAGQWRIREIEVAEADRLVSDRQTAWANALEASGDIRRVINFDLLTKSDSTYPELAGLLAALAGSFWIMAVTLALSLPVGVAAAIYLEEFAPRNRITDFIEVNINNLAAVPSIVFGLLGAAVFINFFDLPRSAPVIGGLVLSLITLPTIIIATRAALGAVPPSIREGALAVGASLPQTVFHHVLPLAAPGILTGAIIGLARALGETAPLLLIGMVAFVAEPPEGPMDPATALPVLIYKWSSAAERAWQPMTSAAIVVLLVFMFAMNALAVYLRRRLERRW